MRGEAKFRYGDELDAIRQTFIEAGEEAKFRAASDADLEYLGSLGIPESVINFFAWAEPVDGIEIKGARLWPISELRVENEDAVPGYVIAPLHYPVIGSTLFGDVYCLDLPGVAADGEPAVMIASHDEIYEDSAPEEIPTKMSRIADSFSDFLRKFAAGELPSDYYDTREEDGL